MPLEDFGEKIGGARKDLRGDFRKADILNLTHIERTKLVRKDMVWPTPDFPALQQEGYSQQGLATIKMLRDSFPAAPIVRSSVSEQDYIVACEIFVDTLNAVRAAIAGAKTPTEISERLRTDERVQTLVAKPNGTKPSSYQLVVSPGAEWHRWEEPPMALASSDKREVMLGMHYGVLGTLSRAMQQTLRKNPEWPNGTSLAERHLRKIGVSIVRVPDGWRIGFMDRPLDSSTIHRFRREPFALLTGTTFSDREAGQQALIKSIEDGAAAERQAKKRKLEALLGRTSGVKGVDVGYRAGPKVRIGPAAGEDYLRDFGMRGGEFGNWVNEVERQEVVNRGYDSFSDLARVLGVEKNQMSLEGTLAIAFGARGYGGTFAAAAHYEPDRRVINLTKPHGEGCLAHEFAHALDHHLGSRLHSLGLSWPAPNGVYELSTAPTGPGQLTKIPAEHRSEAERMLGLATAMRAIWHEDKLLSAEEATERAQAELDAVPMRLQAFAASMLIDWQYSVYSQTWTREVRTQKDAAVRELLNSIEKPAAPGKVTPADELLQRLATISECPIERLGSIRQKLAQYQRLVDSLVLALNRATSPTYAANPIHVRGLTRYALTCRKLDEALGRKTAYFAEQKEMWARAFEAMVADALRANKEVNPFLVFDGAVDVFPSGRERAAINRDVWPVVQAAVKLIRPAEPKLPASHGQAVLLSAEAGAPTDPEPARRAPVPLETPPSQPPRRIHEKQETFDLDFAAPKPKGPELDM